jgi:hypothetical protein
MQRYSCPELDPNKITLFTIIDLWETQNKFPYEQEEHANGFALAYHENSCSLVKTFGFRVASIPEMEKFLGKHSSGYYFYCFKTKPRPINVELLDSQRLLGDGSSAKSSDEAVLAEIIGWGFNECLHLPFAIEQAKYCAYRECRQEAEAMADKTGLPLVEFIHKSLRSRLESACEPHQFDNTLCPTPEALLLYLKKRKENHEREISDDNLHGFVT